MTDETHDETPHEHELEHEAGFEHEQAAAPQGEWTGGEPIDDFGAEEDPAAPEMTSTSAEATDDAQAGAETSEPPKKRGFLYPPSLSRVAYCCSAFWVTGSLATAYVAINNHR